MNDHFELSPGDWHNRYTRQAEWSRDIRQFLFNKISLNPDDKIMEVGSGTGAVLHQLGKEIDTQRYGIDIDISSLMYSAASDRQIMLAAADGHQLPFADNCFNVCYCHYLLLWIKNPLDILLEMKRVTKPGGQVLALAEPDYQARIDYPPPLDHLGTIQTQSLENQGANVSIGRKLKALFNQAGFTKITTGILGAQEEYSESIEFDETEWMMIRSDLAEHLSQANLELYHQFEISARRNGKRILFIPTFYAAGLVQ